jgi:8-oxo-dGTP pyrophosphatase MutT (NUDIX family)
MMRRTIAERLAKLVPPDSPGTQDDTHLRPAAVLVAIVEHPDGETVLLTRRADHLREHAGQISFPGGRLGPGDEGPVDAALREAFEEIHLDPTRVEVAGTLPVYRTGTGFHITPVVGFLRPPLDLRPNPAEVAEVFEVPLAFLLDPANHRRDSMLWHGQVHWYDAVPYRGRYIWGATAGMLVRFSRLLAEAV